MRRLKSIEKIRQEATRVLVECSTPMAPIPVDEIANNLGAEIRYSPFDGENELAGMLMRGDGEIIIGVNSLHHRNRQRFTIAHECGHLLFHPGQEVHIDHAFRINKRDTLSSKASDPDEIEANRFAAELLMPHDMIMNDLFELDIDVEDEAKLKELADKYEVSLQALTHRITNLLKDRF